MAQLTKPLTYTEVKAAKATDKNITLYDGDGLQLLVRVSGSKSWQFRYKRPYTNKRTKLSLGNWPEVSIAEARKKREEAKKLLAQKIDPAEHRAHQEQARLQALNNTFQRTAKQWWEVKKASITEDYAADIWRSLERYVFPFIGQVPINQLTARLFIEILRPVEAQGSLETLRRLTQRINEIMTFAVNTGLINRNPATGIKHAFKAPVATNLPTIKPDELPVFMQALSHASIRVQTRCLIELQLHTMTRPSEAAGAKWDEFDLDKGLWIIPAARMKCCREHIIPLSRQVLATLSFMQGLGPASPYVFPSIKTPQRSTHSQTANAAIKRMGFNNKLVSHGLRALASTTLNEQGFAPDIIEVALAHIDKNEVRRAYNRAIYLEQRKAMMQWWSDHIDSAAQGSLSISGTKSLKAVNQ